MKMNFTLSKNSDEGRFIHSKKGNEEIMIGFYTKETIEELFHSILQRHQEGLEQSKKNSEFVFLLQVPRDKSQPWSSCIDSSQPWLSCIDSSQWLKNKKATFNPKNNKDNNCFQYAITATLNHESIRKPERLSRIEPYVRQYDWKEINFPTGSTDWKKV